MPQQEDDECQTRPVCPPCDRAAPAPQFLVLAGGEGSRMNSDLPEVLHPVAELPVLCHVLRAVQGAQHSDITVVVSSQCAAAVQQVIRDAFPELQVEYVIQQTAESWGGAVHQALSSLPASAAEIIIVSGNLVLLTPTLLDGFAARIAGVKRHERCPYITHFSQDGAQPLVQGAEVAYLHKRAREDGSLSCLEAPNPNLAHAKDAAEVLRELAHVREVSTRRDQAAAEDAVRQMLIGHHQDRGVSFRDPSSTHVSLDVTIGRDSAIGIGVQLLGKTTIGRGVRIDGPTVVKNASIGDGARIGAFSHIEQSTMAPSSGIGPFTRVRAGAAVGAGAYVGNFCELKNASVGAGGNVCHLSYLGDAELAENVNIGAGTITCNFNGVAKNRTSVAANAFIGSNTTLVAPVAVGEGALVAAGSVITADVPADALALGRARQTTKEGRADATRGKLREAEARRGGGGGH